MGTWIGRLRFAEILGESLPGLDKIQFIFGNLAPVSGIPNEAWSKYDPPKMVTHFLGPGEAERRIKIITANRIRSWIWTANFHT